MALKVQKNDYTDFSKQADDLCEAFRRGLRAEGIPPEKAKELTVKKAVELCRKTARSDVVKSVISAANFSNPSEVFAKLVTENDVASKEKREADAFKAKSQQNQSRPNRNNRGNGRGGYKNNGNRGNGNNGNNGNRGQNQYQNRGNGNGNGNYRGNGQNRGRGNGNRNEHTIRLVTGNPLGPNPGHQQQQQPQQRQNEQVFHVPFQ